MTLLCMIVFFGMIIVERGKHSYARKISNSSTDIDSAKLMLRRMCWDMFYVNDCYCHYDEAIEKIQGTVGETVKLNHLIMSKEEAIIQINNKYRPKLDQLLEKNNFC